MIKREKKIIEATCDGCKKSLRSPALPQNVNYGILRSSFGYGSRLDDLGDQQEFHLCEDCWTKALGAVGLEP